MTREEIVDKLEKIAGFFHARADMAIGDGKMLLLSWCNAAEEARGLIEAQEPRVVKMSELTAGEPMLVWLEDIDKEETVAGMIFDYVPGRLGFKLTDLASMDRIYPRIEDYLTRWRCWTSRPADEQRRATPWPN